MTSVKIPDYQLKEYTGGYQSVLLLLSAVSLPIRSGTLVSTKIHRPEIF